MFTDRLWKRRKRDPAATPPPPSLLPSVAIYPPLNGVCLPDLPRMKCHILDWSLSLNRFLCLPWFPRPSLTSLLGHGSLMCQPRLGTLGVGYLWCVHACVCFKVAVWFCSELTRAPEVIKIRRWRTLLEMVNDLGLLCGCMLRVCKHICMCWMAGAMCNIVMFLCVLMHLNGSTWGKIVSWWHISLTNFL